MKVLFDHQIFSYVYGGASKYFTMLLKYLPRECWDTTTLLTSNEYVRAEKLMPFTLKKYFRGQTVLQEYLNRPYSNFMIKKKCYDIFHQTNFGTYCLDKIGSKPMVTTYHDANLSTIDPHPELVEQQRVSLERADSVIVVSENTKKDLLQLFKVDEAKVSVIYHGIEIPDLSKLNHERIVERPYILYVGRRTFYKNFDNFVKACSLVISKFSDIQVVCTSSCFSNKEYSKFKSLGIEDNMKAICCDEADMVRLYRDAIAFVFPSFYEGFGMPILESWSCNCPVVLSTASCFPEIAADAGLYFAPDSVDEMFSQIMKVIEDDALKETLRQRGTERLKKFSWERCANEHLKVYQSLAD